MRQQAVKLATLDTLSDADIVAFCSTDDRPLPGVMGLIDWRISGLLSRCLLQQRMTGEWGEDVLLHVNGRFGPRRLFVFGSGPADRWDTEHFRRMMAHAHDVVCKAGGTRYLLAAPASHLWRDAEHDFVEAVSDQLSEQVEQILYCGS